MVKLGREMTRVLVAEFGPDEFIRRVADPVWFQSLGTVLAFDWNASGLTTILTAALKETIRALALVAEVIYGTEPSYEDPARYSFAHGGKDGTPYGIDRDTYDNTISMMAEAVRRSHISAYEKDRAISRLTTRR